MHNAKVIQFPKSQTPQNQVPTKSVQDVVLDVLARTAEAQNDLCLFRCDLRDMLTGEPTDKNALEYRILAMREIATDTAIEVGKHFSR